MKKEQRRQKPALVEIREATATLSSLRRTLGTSCSGKLIVWVDDHPNNNSIPHRLLEEGGATVISALSTEEAIPVLERRGNTVHLVISDMERADDHLAGMRVLEYLHNAAVKVPAIIYSDNPMAATCCEEIRSLGGIGPILGPKNLIERVSCLFGQNRGDVQN